MCRSKTYFFSSFFASGEEGAADGEDGVAEGEDEPVAPLEGGVEGLEEGEDGEDDGELDIAPPFFEALSPQAARASTATEAISRDLVIPMFLKGIGGAILG